MKAATIALVVRFEGEEPALVETFSDDREIALLEAAVGRGEKDPIHAIYDHRQKIKEEEEEFGNYVEELLSQPFLRPDIQEHGVQWLRSKIRIEQYQRTEADAARTIADFAFRMYREDRDMTDFSLAGPATVIRVRVFVVSESSQVGTPPAQAA